MWNEGTGNGATGGGISDTFPRPDWQAGAGVAAQADAGVPDVAGDADPESGYQVLVDGKAMVIGGTSAVAPLWAALVCRLAEGAARKFGLLAPRSTTGSRRARHPRASTTSRPATTARTRPVTGWDACTGLGVPDGAALLAPARRPAEQRATTDEFGFCPTSGVVWQWRR